MSEQRIKGLEDWAVRAAAALKQVQTKIAAQEREIAELKKANAAFARRDQERIGARGPDIFNDLFGKGRM